MDTSASVQTVGLRLLTGIGPGFQRSEIDSGRDNLAGAARRRQDFELDVKAHL
jgi:hypothetical protein